MLFERAMLWGLLDLQRNPIELIKLKPKFLGLEKEN